MGSACTQVLADIYIRKWESSFVHEQHREHELYSQFEDNIFFTSKKPSKEIRKTLT
jgi:hypothetical protein